MNNCDEVFDILTRGPFPTGQFDDDRRVELHLQACSQCRRLAEALRPAVQLFQEAITPEESRQLPSYQGPQRSGRTVSESDQWLLGAALHRQRPRLGDRLRRPRETLSRAAHNLTRFAAAIAVGLCCALTVHYAARWLSTRPPSGSAVPSAISPSLIAPGAGQLDSTRHRELAGLGLRAACIASLVPAAVAESSGLSPPVQQQAPTSDPRRASCCRWCHVPGEQLAGAHLPTARDVEVCLVCHREGESH